MNDTIDESLDATGHILVADDEAQNRQLLRDILEAQGFTITDAVDGPHTLELVEQHDFDTILLDVMMPGIDGFEVCRRLKSNPAMARIPVLLVTALSERKDRLEGISAGANDYISKPFDTRYVPLRVRNAVRSKRLYDRLQENYRELKRLEEHRDSLNKMIVHDMRSALVGVSGNLELIDMTSKEKLDESAVTCLENALTSNAILVDMTNSLLDISRLESHKFPVHSESVRLSQLAAEAVDTLGASAQQCANIMVAIPEDAPPVVCDSGLIRRVLSNLIGNAVKYVPVEDGHILLEQELDEATGMVRISITDNGPGIAEEHRAKIFQKFGQVEGSGDKRNMSSGLGLTFCKLAVEAHGGVIDVESVVGEGSVFWFDLPKDGPVVE